jgi:dipeptidyl aminopeptidase/acylaminoacyl peptidase
VDGDLTEIEDLALNPLMGAAASWLPDQKRLLVRRIPERGPAPQPPAIPMGPKVVEGVGAAARSTYEARNLLKTAYDDALFDYYVAAELAIVEPAKGKVKKIGDAAHYYTAKFSPDGEYLLIKRLVGPWSHEVAWWRFASEVEVWNKKGKLVASITSLPLADAVPAHGVPEGPRSVSWRATAPHTLYWVEALDGGDPMAEVDHRDRLMRLEAPFNGEPEEVFLAEHRVTPWQMVWGDEGGTLMLGQRERMRRWRYVWLLDVDEGTSRLWFDLNEGDRYASPGSPMVRPLPNGQWVLHQREGAVYFNGSGATEKGDRPFLDLRDMKTGESERLFRCDPDRYEVVTAFAGDEDRLVIRSESAVDVPNYYLATLGEEIEAAEGEATRAVTRQPITRFEDHRSPVSRILRLSSARSRSASCATSARTAWPSASPCNCPLATWRARRCQRCSTPTPWSTPARPPQARSAVRPSASAASTDPLISISCSGATRYSTRPPCR